MYQEQPNIYELRVYPTYAVHYKQRQGGRRKKLGGLEQLPIKKSEKQIENEKNLKNNSTNGELSKKAVRKMCNAIDWLVVSSKEKRIKNSLSGKYFNFKVNFITLTLPFTQGSLSDNKVKSELLNPFLTFLKTKYDLNKYVWKAETQENGNIHFHLVADVYIPHEELRFYWNRLIIKKGYMEEYTSKFKDLSFFEYFKQEYKKGKNTKEILKKRYKIGKLTGWKNPNSTDVKAVKHVKNIASYIATYMSKKEEGKRNVVGRIWGCSYNLSSENKCILEMDAVESNKILNEFDRNLFESKLIESKPDEFGKTFVIAELFFYSTNDFIQKVKGTLKNAFITHIESINEFKALNHLFSKEALKIDVCNIDLNIFPTAGIEKQQKLIF